MCACRDCTIVTKLLLSVYLVAMVTSLSVLLVWFVLDNPMRHPTTRSHGTHARVRHRHSAQHWGINLPSPVIYKNFSHIVHIPLKVRKHNFLSNIFGNTTRVKNVVVSRLVYSVAAEYSVLKFPWVLKLKEFVTTTSRDPDPQVSMVVADTSCLRLLLNWLIAALVRLSRPLHNVLVLALEAEVCDVLTPRKLNCLYTDPKSLIEQPKTENYLFSKHFVGVQIRLLAARLINYWGYSFASYDTDAIVLRNPQELFDAHRDVEVIGGAAQYWPVWAVQNWGFALCPGAMMIRSSKATG